MQRLNHQDCLPDSLLVRCVACALSDHDSHDLLLDILKQSLLLAIDTFRYLVQLFKSFLTVSQDLKVNLCGLQQDNVVTVMVRIIMWELPGNSHTVAIQWVHMVKDPPATILLVHTVTSKYTFCYQ